MSINLSKGGRINLSKSAPSLKRVRIGLGWNPNAFSTGQDFDLDASVFICKDSAGSPILISDPHFVFYNNTRDPEGATVHSGDNRVGDSAGDDETVTVELSKLNPLATELSFIVTIHDAVARKQNFGQVTKSYIKLYNDETGEVVAQYSLEDDFSMETAVQFGSLYKNDAGEWLFKAVGQGYQKGLDDFVRVYGGNLA